MITITDRTVVGASGMTLAEMDAETVQASAMLGGPNVPEGAADYLRNIYREVIAFAGSVKLDVTRKAVRPVRTEVAA
jgi:hypothetical protein